MMVMASGFITLTTSIPFQVVIFQTMMMMASGLITQTTLILFHGVIFQTIIDMVSNLTIQAIIQYLTIHLLMMELSSRNFFYLISFNQ